MAHSAFHFRHKKTESNALFSVCSFTYCKYSKTLRRIVATCILTRGRHRGRRETGPERIGWRRSGRGVATGGNRMSRSGCSSC